MAAEAEAPSETLAEKTSLITAATREGSSIPREDPPLEVPLATAVAVAATTTPKGASSSQALASQTWENITASTSTSSPRMRQLVAALVAAMQHYSPISIPCFFFSCQAYNQRQ